jgi:hypothetical protein
MEDVMRSVFNTIPACMMMMVAAAAWAEVDPETPQAVIDRYAFSDWQGAYTFADEETIVLPGGAGKLRLLRFTQGFAGDIVVLLEVNADGSLSERYVSPIISDGVRPKFEAVDALGALVPGSQILTLRWVQPGNGHYRQVDVLSFHDHRIERTTALSEGFIHGSTNDVWTVEDPRIFSPPENKAASATSVGTKP